MQVERRNEARPHRAVDLQLEARRGFHAADDHPLGQQDGVQERHPCNRSEQEQHQHAEQSEEFFHDAFAKLTRLKTERTVGWCRGQCQSSFHFSDHCRQGSAPIWQAQRQPRTLLNVAATAHVLHNSLGITRSGRFRRVAAITYS